MKSAILASLLGLLVLSSAPGPVMAWERIETRNGEVYRGTISDLELVLADDRAGEAILPRASLETIEVGEEGHVTATLKDGTVVQGEASASIVMSLGLMQRRFPLTTLRQIDFDRFVPGSYADSVEACPLRVEVPIPELSDKTKRWRRDGAPKIQCEGTYLTGLIFRWKEAGGIRIGDREAAVSELRVTPIMLVGGEGYQTLTLDMRLVEGTEVLGKTRKTFLIGPRERRQLDEMLIQYYRTAADPWPKAPKLQIQALLTETQEPPKPQTATWWFWIAF